MLCIDTDSKKKKKTLINFKINIHIHNFAQNIIMKYISISLYVGMLYQLTYNVEL